MTQKQKHPTTLSSLRQVAARLGISLGTTRKLVEDGELTAIRLSARCVRISDSEVEAFLASRQLLSSASSQGGA